MDKILINLPLKKILNLKKTCVINLDKKNSIKISKILNSNTLFSYLSNKPLDILNKQDKVTQ